MKANLSALILVDELKRVVDAMQVGKSPGSDGLVLQFYKFN
jgi:hypothetical protein